MVIFGVVVYRCGRKSELREVRSRTRRPTARNQQLGLHKPYGETIQYNAAYDVAVPELPAYSEAYSEIADEATYIESDPNRPALYDGGFLPGA